MTLYKYWLTYNHKEKIISASSLLVAFSHEQPARLLVDYLQNQGINAHYFTLDAEQNHGVQVLEPSQWQSAKLIAEEFIANPHALKYQEAAWQTGHAMTESSTSGWFSMPTITEKLKNAPLTSIVLMLCLITYCFAVIGISAPYEWLRIQPFSELAQNHQWWRLFGPAFIHFSILHISFNILWWWILGSQIEQTFGRVCLLSLFLFTAFISNVAQLLIDGPNFGGLSGVVYGLVGCVWWLGWLKPSWGISLPKPIIGFLLVWLVVGYTGVLWLNMANTAHTAGLISGCLFALILTRFEIQKTNLGKGI